MAQSKSLMNYQRGYTGVVVDLEAMKPWERKCYLLGVWHVASAIAPYVTSGSVVRAIREMVKQERPLKSRKLIVNCNCHEWVFDGPGKDHAHDWYKCSICSYRKVFPD